MRAGGQTPGPEVLVLGEALVDVVREPDATELRFPGGSPMNVAVALGRLGAGVQLQTAIGADSDGDLIAAHLAGSSVTLLEPRKGRTSTATASIAPNGAAEYEFEIEWSLAERPAPRAAIVHAGSIALFLEPGASVVERALTSARGLVSVDPNIRPALLPSPEEARRRLERLLRVVDVLKISDEDCGWLYPDITPLDAVGRIRDAGVPLVVLTRGASGSVLLSSVASAEVPAPRVEVVDTIGAGDTYMGALLFGVLELIRERAELRGLPASELFRLGRFAAAAAAVTVSRRGADSPTLVEVHRALSASAT